MARGRVCGGVTGRVRNLLGKLRGQRAGHRHAVLPRARVPSGLHHKVVGEEQYVPSLSLPPRFATDDVMDDNGL